MSINDELKAELCKQKKDIDDMADRMFPKASHAENSPAKNEFKLSLYKHHFPNLNWEDSELLKEVGLNG